MDPRLLHYYRQELQHIREMAGEFAAEFPKIAGRLALDGFECADPYVERLLEGFAYLAARVQLKVDSEFPRFTQQLLDMVYPHYLSPLPSMAVVQIQPDLNATALTEGYLIPKGTALRSQIGKGEQTACEYRTAHDLELWPLELLEAEYLSGAGAVAACIARTVPGVKSGLRLRLQTAAGLPFKQLNLKSLALYLRGSGELPMQIYEQLLAKPLGVMVQPVPRPLTWQHWLQGLAVVPQGFSPEQALLPYTPRSFQGYRLLQEYFGFPERFLFVELTQLQAALASATDEQLNIIILSGQHNPQLVNAVTTANFGLFCTPVVNLFPKRADRIHLSEQTHEHHIVPDRTRPLDYEVYQVTEVKGYGGQVAEQQDFLPFYQAHSGPDPVNSGYYTLSRLPRIISSRQKLHGSRSHYAGQEWFISIVDAREAPYRSELKQLGIELLCTNRDLPLQMPVAVGKTDFTIQTGAPVLSIRCLSGPTRPKPAAAYKDTAWKLLNHLSLNYLSLLDSNPAEGATALRSLLSLYGDGNNPDFHKQLEGLRSIRTTPLVKRIGSGGPMAFGRGLEIELTVEETAFTGTGVFLLGMVLEQFFAQYISLNTFTQTVLKSTERGELMRWPIRTGQRRLA